MGISSIPYTILLICFTCSCVRSHIPKISSSVISHAGLAIDPILDPRRRLRLTKVDELHSPDAISPIFLKTPAMTVAPSSTDQHFQWWDSNSPELVQSGWYGFNRFTSRAARNMGQTSSRKARASYLLGESSQVKPLTTYKTETQQQKQYDEDLAIHEVLRELQRHIRPVPQREYVEPRIIMIDEAFGLPPGILVPVVRPPQHNNILRHSNYRPPNREIRRLASAPTPVTIKVVPLKITSVDIANALKSMSFLPIPLDFLKADNNAPEGNVQVNFDDKTSSDDETDIPPPSSHVATPLDAPLGITYAEAQRADHFIRNYQPRK